MFYLPNPPSPNDEAHEKADFIEWCAWHDGYCSARAANTMLNQINDNNPDTNNGCDDDSDQTSDDLEDVFLEIERRAKACGGGYPFDLDRVGSVLSHRKDGDSRYIIYRYLLLSTRLNMKNNRNHAGINGTELLEHLGARVMQNYLGGKHVESKVFGTAQQGSFQKKVDDLCASLGEGGGFANKGNGKVHAKDAKLDVFTWAPFSDGNPGKLIIFTQCKTGDNWKEHLGLLKPERIFNPWTKDPGSVILAPMTAFCVAEAVFQPQWIDVASFGGLFLDRCRLVDFAYKIDKDLLDKLTKWTAAAFQNVCRKNIASKKRKR